jgi:hypothetical protein
MQPQRQSNGRVPTSPIDRMGAEDSKVHAPTEVGTVRDSEGDDRRQVARVAGSVFAGADRHGRSFGTRYTGPRSSFGMVNPSRAPIPLQRWLPWLLGGLAAAFMVLGGGLWLLVRALDSPARVSNQTIEDVGRVHLPPSARDVQAALEGFQDRLLHLRFDMAAADLPSFESGLTCRLGPVSTAPPTALAGSLEAPWWTPTRGHAWRACEGDAQWFHQSAAVEVSRPGRATVYLVVFEH